MFDFCESLLKFVLNGSRLYIYIHISAISWTNGVAVDYYLSPSTDGKVLLMHYFFPDMEHRISPVICLVFRVINVKTRSRLPTAVSLLTRSRVKASIRKRKRWQIRKRRRHCKLIFPCCFLFPELVFIFFLHCLSFSEFVFIFFLHFIIPYN